MPTAQEEVEMNKLIEKLQQTGNVLKRKYEAEKQRMKELHALQRQVEAKVSEQADYKQTKGGLDACTMQDLKAQKKLNFLEIRVNDLKRKISLLNISNNKKKNEINKCRQNLVLCDTVHKSLSVEFEEDKEKMALLMDESNEIYNEQQDAKMKTNELIALDISEGTEHRAEMDRLGALLEKEAAAREFIEKATKKQKAQKVDDHIEVSKTADEENALRNKLKSLKQNLKDTKEHIKNVDKRLITAEAAFSKLRQISGLETTREIVDLFIMNEDENYSLFNFIQQTKEEVDAEEEMLNTIIKNQERFQREQNKLSDHEFKVVNDLKTRRAHVEDSVDKVMRKLAISRLNLGRICSGVSQMFAHLGCDIEGGDGGGEEARAVSAPTTPGTPGQPPMTPGPTSPTAKSSSGPSLALMAGEGVQENTVMTYLGIIEQRANELIQEYVRKNSLAKTQVRAGVNVRVSNPFGPNSPFEKRSSNKYNAPPPPIIEDALNDIDEEDSYLPIPRNEMMNRVARTVDMERAAKLMTSESAPQLASVGGNKGGNDGRRGGRRRKGSSLNTKNSRGGRKNSRMGATK